MVGTLRYAHPTDGARGDVIASEAIQTIAAEAVWIASSLCFSE
jgi:hypothetical protein